LGGHQEPQLVTPISRGDAKKGTSLFCFSVVSDHLGPPGVGCPPTQHNLKYGCPDRHSYERPLINAIQNRGFGIFQCDAHALYDAPLAPKAAWLSFANTDIFMKIWDRVEAEGVYKKHDWIVKVDPDAVFLPARLKHHLARLPVPAKQAAYVENCAFKFKFMGALEIMSPEALDLYLANKKDCRKFLGASGGEDFWMKSCLNAIGVPHVVDSSLLNDKYTLGNHECRAAGTCVYDVKDTSPCANSESVAFHPYKDADVWMQCHDRAEANAPSMRFLQN
jgi:hypothetical protein